MPGYHRFVRRKDADPELGVLNPHVSTEQHYLVYNKLPFSEDLRRYRFASFSNTKLAPSPEQQALASELVQSLALPPDPTTGRSLR